MEIMKKQTIIVKFILIISSLLLFNCKKAEEDRIRELREEYEKRGWSAGMCSPMNYFCIGQHVYYFNKGKIIGNAATLTALCGTYWSEPSSSRGSTNIHIFPDSVYVTYTALNDKNQMIDYKGGMSLPEKKIEELYKKKYLKNGELEKFISLTTGMAPGGRICVWLDHVEIKRGVVKEVSKFRDYPSFVCSDSIEISDYLKHYPLKYSFWDKPDPRYELDFGLCSENNDEFEFFYGEFISKEGLRNLFDENYLDLTQWNVPCNAKADYKGKFYQQIGENYNPHKLQLPVDLKLSWKIKNSKIYFTSISLPKDFKNKFTKPYINPITGKKCNYHRLVFGIEKDRAHCIIWLDGPDKQEKLLRFKGRLDMRGEDDKSDYYDNYATEITYY